MINLTRFVEGYAPERIYKPSLTDLIKRFGKKVKVDEVDRNGNKD